MFCFVLFLQIKASLGPRPRPPSVMEFGVTPRRHNPVDSICRKLQTIQRRDREPNSPFQIPKLQSSSYESPHTSLRRNLDSILKKRKGDAEQNSSPLVLTPGAARVSGRTPVTPLSPVNATYTIAGTLAEKSSATLGHSRAWQLSSSTPAIQDGDARFSFTPNNKERSRAPAHGLLSYNLNFCSSDASTILDCELPYPALVVKRLSMGDGTHIKHHYTLTALKGILQKSKGQMLNCTFKCLNFRNPLIIMLMSVYPLTANYFGHTAYKSLTKSDTCTKLNLFI